MMAGGASFAPNRWSFPADAMTARSSGPYLWAPRMTAPQNNRNCVFSWGVVPGSSRLPWVACPVSTILSGQRQLSCRVCCHCSFGLMSPMLRGGSWRPWRGRVREGARRATGRTRPRQGRGGAPREVIVASRKRARATTMTRAALTAQALDHTRHLCRKRSAMAL